MTIQATSDGHNLGYEFMFDTFSPVRGVQNSAIGRVRNRFRVFRPKL